MVYSSLFLKHASGNKTEICPDLTLYWELGDRRAMLGDGR